MKQFDLSSLQKPRDTSGGPSKSDDHQDHYDHDDHDDHSDEERSAAVEAARLAALLNISEVVFMSRRERVWEHYKDDRMRLIDSNMHIVDVYPDAKKSGRPLPYEKN